MKSSDLVSVIVNCYNGEKYLREALQSVIDQDYKNWELIFWDNLSTDLSKNIFEEFKDTRFKYYLAQEHTVLYKARNLALEKCSGKYIAFLDVDDCWERSKLSMQIPVFLEDNIGLVFSDYWLLNERKKNKRLVTSTRANAMRGINFLVSNYSICMSSIMILNSVIKKNGIKFDTTYQIIGDFKMVLDIHMKYKISCVEKPLVTYRWHGENTSIKQKDRHLIELKNLEKIYQHEDFIKNLREKIAYLEITELIMCGKRFEAIAKLKNIHSFVKIIKIIVGMSAPLWLVRKMRV